MSSDTTATMAVEQAFFHRDQDGSASVLASSLADDDAHAAWTELIVAQLGQDLGTGEVGLSYLTLPGGFAAIVRRRGAGDGIDAHALLGRPHELTPEVALASAQWPGWRDERPADRRMARLAIDEVDVPGAARALRAGALRQADLLACALAWMLQAPRSALGLVGCAEDDRAALVWGLREIATADRGVHGITDRPWTFSTHGDPDQGQRPAVITFFTTRSDARHATDRIVVDLRSDQSASPQNINEAFAMVYRYEFGFLPGETGPRTDMAGSTNPVAPRALPAPGAPTPGGPPAAPPVPAGRYAELVRDLTSANDGQAVASALAELEYAVADRDDRDGLRAELEGAGWGLAALQRVEIGARERAHDRLVGVAFGATAPGLETDAAHADARRLAATAESDDLVRALARAAEGSALDGALAQRWMRQHLPVTPDPDKGLGPVGRFLRRRGRPMTAARERLVLAGALAIALGVVFLVGVVVGMTAA